ncbi:BTAD domain-containing putative transcriptional regulator [Dactylosporangium sp. CA-233914]|uniref:BTAD domain-containing putative transcriptional regulator n=1 Tax=Dactylosporangium sp. CA-233914 TaxID=3239934 RepID=UPI003D92EB8F
MRITTLGELAVDGRPVRGERLAAVVRALVEARGRTVTPAALAESVWGGAPPADTAGAVHALIARARRLGLPVDAVAGGYRVAADAVEPDTVLVKARLDTARAALRRQDPTGAAAHAGAARELFPRSPDLTGNATVTLFADVVAIQAEAVVDTGRAGNLIADLTRLIERTPPHEPSAALLIRVLAAQGRQAEALAVVERLRETLAELYGTDPSPLVTDTHLALLLGELDAKPATTTTAQHPPGNPRPARGLPPAWRRAATAMVGREDDVAAVREALGQAPLVTVVAVGGAGKTRLAAEVARRAAAEGGAVHVVELAGVRSPAGVLPAVLAAADPTPGKAAETDERLHELSGLLVLDNCEHILDGAADAVAEVLAAAPDVAVLATSRAPLGLPGEIVHRLHALDDATALALLTARARAGGAEITWAEKAPDIGKNPAKVPAGGSPGTGSGARSGRNGARDANHGGRSTASGPEDAELTTRTQAAVRLCRRLDNLPLALELAAARLRHMPIEDVLAGLDDRFGLLDDALRGLPERHASLWAMVDWSRELLKDDQRRLLERLAVIPAPFTREVAEAVSGLPGRWLAVHLAALVEQSLLVLEDGSRYRMLETVREYGEARLTAAGGRDAAMDGLVAWAREAAPRLHAEFLGPGQLGAFARCCDGQDNLVAALRWAAGRDEPAAVDIAVALFHLWTIRGLYFEVVPWAMRLLSADDPGKRRAGVLIETADAERLAWIGLLAGLNAFAADSRRAFTLPMRMLRRLVARRGAEISPRVSALANLMPALAEPDPDKGLAAAERLIVHPDPYTQGFGLLMRSAIRENRGDFVHVADRTADVERAYRNFELVGDHWGMGMAAQAIGTQSGAGEWLRRSAHHMELLGAADDAGSIRIMLDVQLAGHGDDAAAQRLREAADAPAAEPAMMGLQVMDAAQAHLGLGLHAWVQGRRDEAVAHAERASAIADGLGVPVPQIRVVFAVAAAVLNLRAYGGQGAARAVQLLEHAREEALSVLDVPGLGSWAMGGSALAAHRGAAAAAQELWALAERCAANASQLFSDGADPVVDAVLGDAAARADRLAAWCERPMTEVTDRIRELVDVQLR